MRGGQQKVCKGHSGSLLTMGVLGYCTLSKDKRCGAGCDAIQCVLATKWQVGDRRGCIEFLLVLCFVLMEDFNFYCCVMEDEK